MKRNALFLPVLLLAVYLPFEDFLLKWLPVSDTVFLSLRQLPDLVVLSLFLFIIIDTAYRENRIYTIDTKAFLFLSAFILQAFLTIFLNRSSPVDAVLNIKALVRYIPLIYVILYMNPTERQSTIFLRTVLAIAFIEVLIGAAQFLGGEPVKNIFKPFEFTEGPGLAFTAMRYDELFGTMSYTINYAYFLLLALVLLLCFRTKLLKNPLLAWPFALLLLAAIFLSGSRSAFLAAFIGILIYVHLTRGILVSGALVISGIAVLALALLFVEKSSSQDFWFFLSSDYLHILEKQRLGMVRVFLNYSGDPHLLYGLSSDKSYVTDYISHQYSLPAFFAEKTLNSIEDVYWIALAIYYGIIGLALFVLFIYFFYRKLRTLDLNSEVEDLKKRMFLSAKILLILFVPLNFINQAFEVRHLAFYVWAVAGLAASHLCNEDAGDPAGRFAGR